MAITTINEKNRNGSLKYIGLSSDTKPTLTAQNAGVEFYEYDTRNYYVLNSAGSWSLKSGKALTTTPLSAIVATTTSSVIDMNNYKNISLEITTADFTTGNWVVELLGCMTSDGTFGNIYKEQDAETFVQQKVPSISVNGTYIYTFLNIGAKYLKIKGTRTTDGTLTVKVTPFN